MREDIIKERAVLVLEHARIIQSRIAPINEPDDFIATEQNLLLYDSIITRLQAIGENCKKIQKEDSIFFNNTVPLDIKAIIRFRDLISHHYELLDYEIIYQICVEEIPKLIRGFEKYLASKEK